MPEILISRRQLLGLAIGAATEATLAACTSPKSQNLDNLSQNERSKLTPQPALPPATPTPTVTEKAKERLYSAVEKLPSSLIKELLTDKALRYFQLKTPGVIKIRDFELTVHNSSVVYLPQTQSDLLGKFTLFAGPNGPAIYPEKTAIIKFPYLGLLLPSDILFPKTHFLRDGTPFIEITYYSSKSLYHGISPEISIEINQATGKEPDNGERFILTKELTHMLLEDIYIELACKKMAESGIGNYLRCRYPDGSTKDTEIISHSNRLIFNNMGRRMAAFDLAAYFIAFTALKEDKSFNTAVTSPSHQRAIRSMGEMKESTAEDLFYRSLRWALTSPEALGLYHAGNIQNIP